MAKSWNDIRNEWEKTITYDDEGRPIGLDFFEYLKKNYPSPDKSPVYKTVNSGKRGEIICCSSCGKSVRLYADIHDTSRVVCDQCAH